MTTLPKIPWTYVFGGVVPIFSHTNTGSATAYASPQGHGTGAAQKERR